jgi:hypothetical protein
VACMYLTEHSGIDIQLKTPVFEAPFKP